MSVPNPAVDSASIAGILGGTSDPALGILVDALSGSGRVDPLAVLRAQLDAQVQDNPQLAQIMRLLEQRQQQRAESQNEVTLPSEEEVYPKPESSPEETWEENSRHVQELQDIVNNVYAELEALRVRNDALAGALGACHICFGEDPLCDECSGRGVPGSLPPKPAAFRKYVLPAFRRARAIETRRSVSASQPEPRVEKSKETLWDSLQEAAAS